MGIPNWEIRLKLGHPISDVSLWRWNSLYEETMRAILDPKGYRRKGRDRLLTNKDEMFMCTLAQLEPQLFIDELKGDMEDQAGHSTSITTVHAQLIKRLNITLERCSARTIGQDRLARQRFIDHFKTMPAEYLVFTGGSGCQHGHHLCFSFELTLKFFPDQVRLLLKIVAFSGSTAGLRKGRRR